MDRGATRVGARLYVAGEATRQMTRLGSSTGARYDGLTDRVPVAPVVGLLCEWLIDGVITLISYRCVELW